MQQDMFETETSPLVGLAVLLERDIDRQKPCHGNIAVIHRGKGPHLGELRCKTCGRHRGWVSKEMGAQLLAIIEKFGPPEAPLTIREQTYPTITARSGKGIRD